MQTSFARLTRMREGHYCLRPSRGETTTDHHLLGAGILAAGTAARFATRAFAAGTAARFATRAFAAGTALGTSPLRAALGTALRTALGTALRTLAAGASAAGFATRGVSA